MTACPKPKDQKRAVRPVIVYRDGRQVCDRLTAAGKAEYDRRVTLMWERQNKTCCLCQQPIRRDAACFEHEDGRGMGGGHRNDAITDKRGNWINGAACVPCNSAKGSKRVRYNP